MKFGNLSAFQSVGVLSTKIAIVAAASIGGASLVSSSVFATLTASATNTSPNIVTSGNLSLAQASGIGFNSVASGGFVTTITGMAPTDSVVRLVTLTNNGSLNMDSMTVRVVDGTATPLSTNGTTGLQVAISQCTVAYTQATAGVAYACTGGTETTVRASSSLLSLATAQAMTLNAASLLSAGSSFLKITITLPDSTENTLNGTPALGTASIQGRSASLTWTFNAGQRTGITTNS